MVTYSGNPRSPAIIRAAKLAHQIAGISVAGQLPIWTTVASDPGKFVFWVDGLVECGVDKTVAWRLTEDLARAKRSW